ncbi:cyclin-domain-containing protein [Abortiporus biennis]|nr:cyclin-domain-containing protein [Abortiporus biennis]
MLALAHPFQHTPVDCSAHRPSPSSAPSSRSTRSSTRKSSYSTHTISSSSSAAVPTSSSTSRSSSREGPSSPKSAVSQSHSSYGLQSSQSIYQHQPTRGGDPPLPPPSGNGPSDPSHVAQRAQSDQFNIHTYDPQQLLRLLASLLTQIATTNDNLTHRDPNSLTSFQPRVPTSPVAEHHNHPPIWRTLTTASREALSSTSSLTFHARNIPSITLEAYLIRILKYCPASNEVFLSLLVYFDRMSKLAKEASGKLFVIDSYNIHRLVIAGVTVASKFFSDVFYTNSRYAKVGGLPQAELNQLELQFLLLNDFRLMISMEEMQSYAEQLIRFSQSNADPSVPPFTPYSASYPHTPSPAGPTKFMNYMDSHHQQPSEISPSYSSDTRPSETPQVGPNRSYRRSTSTFSATSASDVASETETEFDGSTDDEPTIRPTHSSASSETMSLHSTASDADSMYTDDDDGARESDSESVAARGTPGRDYRMMSP